MDFDDAVARERERLAGERARLSTEQEMRAEVSAALVEQATSSVASAAALLADSDAPRTFACRTHRERPRWRWPSGRPDIEGWLLTCGDDECLLTIDGRLTALHRCDDRHRTPCACTLMRFDHPLPLWAMTLAEPETPSFGPSAQQEADGEEPPTLSQSESRLQIWSPVDGVTTAFDFNHWLVAQVAALIDGAQPTEAGGGAASGTAEAE